MNRDSVLLSPPFAHQGEFLANGTIWNMCPCVVADVTNSASSSQGVTYLQNKKYLKQITDAHDTTGNCTGNTPVYYAYKWPTDDDYLGRNSLTNNWISSGEGVIGLRHMPGIKIQTYTGTDYVAADGSTKIGLIAPIASWDATSFAAVTAGTKLQFMDNGQLTDDTTDSTTVRAIVVDYKNNWLTIELV